MPIANGRLPIDIYKSIYMDHASWTM